MRTEFRSEDLLPLSGLQHFLFCRRQWALIHVERAWAENQLTVEGRQMHKGVDDPFFNEVREGVITTRSVPIASYRLGLYGVCDLVEFSPASEGIQLNGRQGIFLPAPVEYKRGTKKNGPADEAQVCAQAICLEEMLSVSIPTAYLYYGQLRHRVKVDLTLDLRALVEKSTQEMHTYFERGHTPRVRPGKMCQSCSLADLCLPELQANNQSASRYIDVMVNSD